MGAFLDAYKKKKSGGDSVNTTTPAGGFTAAYQRLKEAKQAAPAPVVAKALVLPRTPYDTMKQALLAVPKKPLEPLSLKITQQAQPDFSTAQTTPQETTENTASVLTSAAKAVPQVAKVVGQGTARGYAATGGFIAEKLGTADSRTIDPKTFLGNEKLGKAIFGTDKPFDATSEDKELLEALNLGGLSEKTAGTLTVALGVLDAMPGGGGLKGIVRSLKRANTTEDVTKVLKSAGLSDIVISEVAPKLAKSTDDKEIIQTFTAATRKHELFTRTPAASEAADSVISYITKDGEKVFTRLTPDELTALKDELKAIPASSANESQIHLDANPKRVAEVAREVDRTTFISNHAQARKAFESVLKADALPSPTALTPDEIAQLPKTEQRYIEETPEINPGGIDELRDRTRGVVGDEAAKAKARELGFTEDQVLGFKLGRAFNEEEQLAIRGITANVRETYESYRAALSTLDEGTPEYLELAEQAGKEKVKLARLRAVERGAAAEAGRSLRAFQLSMDKITQEEQLFSKWLANKEVADELKEYALKKLETIGDDADEVADLLRSMRQATALEMAVEFATAIKLTAIPTFVVNTATSAAMLFNRFALRPIAAIIDSVDAKITGQRRERFLADIKNEAIGQWMGWKMAPRNALKALSDENFAQKAKQVKDFNPRGPAIKGRPGKDTWFDKALDKTGKVIRMPFRLLGVQDTVLRQPAHWGEMYVAVGRLAIQKGLKPGTDEYARFMGESVSNPSPDLIKQAHEAANETLFQDDLHPILAKLDSIRHDLPAVKFIVPFFHTLANLINRAIEFSPVAPVLPSVRKQLSLPGTRADALAKMTLGTVATLGLVQYALEDRITLAAPKNPVERDDFFASGKQAYSVQIGDKWYPYARFSPFAEWFTAAAAVGQSIKNEDEMGTAERMSHVFFIMSANFLDKSFVAGMQDFFEATQDPTKAEKWLQNFVTGATIPSGVASVARATDPVFREVNSVKDAYMAKLPWLSEKLDSKVDVFGKDLMRPGSGIVRFISPVVPSPVTVDMVREELKAIDKSISFPAQTAFGFEVTDEQYRDIKIASGQLIYNVLADIMKQESYQAMPDRAKEKLVDSVVDRVREQVRTQYATDQLIMSKIKDRLKQSGQSSEAAEEQAIKVFEYMKKGTDTPQPATSAEQI